VDRSKLEVEQKVEVEVEEAGGGGGGGEEKAGKRTLEAIGCGMPRPGEW